MAAFEDSIFAGASLCASALGPYGFSYEEGEYRYRTLLLDGAFELRVTIHEDGLVTTRLLDMMTGDDYVLYRLPTAHGEFVVSVRDAIKGVLYDIKEKCFTSSPHTDAGFSFLTDYFANRYGETLEYLWDDENCILRRQDNQKWYAVFMYVPYVKIGLEQEGKASIVGIRGDPSEIDGKTIFPGYHLNKKSWVCMALDGRCDNDELRVRLEHSRELALKKK